jgi:DNA-binding Lrp family transcriptional regulator
LIRSAPRGMMRRMEPWTSLPDSDRRILQFVRESSPNGVFRLAQAELGRAAGIPGRTVARSMKRLRTAGVIEAVDPFARPVAYRLNPAALPPEMGE